jgi:cold shock CspA family protein
MTREKLPDDNARESAPAPLEPLGTRGSAIGTVKWWRSNKGYGAIATPATEPWDVWCHFSSVDRPQWFTLPSGERVPVSRDAEGYATLPSGERLLSGYTTGEFVQLHPGEPVDVEYVRADQESFRYVATRVRRPREVVQAEAEVRRIFREFVSDVGLRKIADGLSTDGIPLRPRLDQARRRRVGAEHHLRAHEERAIHGQR